jgi:hypoxanthine phosphoribosyltransferase
MTPITYNWQNIEGATVELARQLNASKFHPDLIVGISRGGVIPAVLLSQYLSVPMKAVNIDPAAIDQDMNMQIIGDALCGMNILVMDDCSYTGATLNTLKVMWQEASKDMASWNRWNQVWHNTVRFAVITDDLASDAGVDYSVYEYSAEISSGVVYPWQNFWNRA